MRDKLHRRIKELKFELEAVQKIIDEMDNGRTDSKSGALQTHQWVISRRWAFGLIFLAAFLLLDGSLQSQQQSDDALYIDSSGRVGIGTTQPMAALEVRAPAGSASAIRFGDPAGHASLTAGSTSFGLRDQAANNRLTILQSNGNVGIGTDQPQAKLEIAQNQAIKVGNAYLSSGGNYTHLANNEWYDGKKWQATAPGALIQLRGQNTIFYTHDEKGSHVNRMIVNSAGNVGIGTSNPKSKLQVMGDTMIYGKVTHSGRRQVDDLPENTYQISPRYHLSLSGRAYGGKTKTIPSGTLKALCADPDGCQVRLAMTRWSANTQPESASVFFTFYYSPTNNGHWRASSTDAANASGVDGDGKIMHVRNIWNTCYFTDGTYANYKQVGDKTQGMQLLVWNGYKNINRTCELTLID
jgi:hypothetical protein